MKYIIEQSFHRLTVISQTGGYCYCRCACGIKKTVRTDKLKDGTTRSCGCLAAELLAQRVEGYKQARLAKKIFRDNKPKKIKKDWRTRRLTAVWYAMVQRCHNPNNRDYKFYGARGISVCDAWHHREIFLADMLPRYRAGWWMERIDNNAGYNPDNCVFRTARRQSYNRSNTLILAGDATRSLAQECEINKVPYMHGYHWFKRLAAEGEIPTYIMFMGHFCSTPETLPGVPPS